MDPRVAKSKTAKRPALLSPQGVDEQVNAVFTALTHDLGRPFMAGSRNVRSIVRSWCPLLHGNSDMDVDGFRRSYVSAHFLDRYFYSTETTVAKTLESQALEKFKANLGRGYRMNSWKLRFLPHGKLNTILCSASLEVARILGDLDVDEWFAQCGHGPNATYGVRRENSYADVKMTTIEGTLPALRLFESYLDWNTNLQVELEPRGLGKPGSWTVRRGNKLSFVPKKFDSLRTMMIEPTTNQFFQQGLGSYISNRLKHAGIELETQPDVHRRLVRIITKHHLEIATIDWSQASDRIWLGLCERLLPSDWFAALEDVRSPVCEYRGDTLVLTMAGSMGCGFTFPLQTLLFLCLLRALARESGREQFVTVFGDDCIVDSDLREEVEWLASELDWKLNSDKSFFDGDFRESCGVDAFRGTDCRPFMVERPDDCVSRPALVSWAYGVFNLIRKAVGDCPTPHVEAWLLAFLRLLRVKRINFVPYRFSVRAGVRVKPTPHPGVIESLFPVLTGSPDGPTFSVDGCDRDGWSFDFIGTARERRPVDPTAYYLLALEGKGVPQDFKSAQLCIEEDSEARQGLGADSAVPCKVAHFRRKCGYVHTWYYLFDDLNP